MLLIIAANSKPWLFKYKLVILPLAHFISATMQLQTSSPRTLPVFIDEQNLVEIVAVVSAAMLSFLHLIIHIKDHRPWRENVKTWCQTKLEVHHLSQSQQKTIELWLQSTCTENWLKFGHVVLHDIWVDRQTDTRHTWQYFASLILTEQIIRVQKMSDTEIYQWWMISRWLSV